MMARADYEQQHRRIAAMRAGAQDKSTVRSVDEPAPTITGGNDYGERVWLPESYNSRDQRDGRTGEPNRQRGVEPTPTSSSSTSSPSPAPTVTSGRLLPFPPPNGRPMTVRLPGFDLSPEQVLDEAEQLGPFVARVVLFSGGGDSTAVLHHALANEYAEEAAFVDTGTALPGVRDHVEQLCRSWAIPLTVWEAGDAYERMVLDPRLGFPGPAQHHRAYQRLKERQIRKLVASKKTRRTDRVLLVSGVRRHESKRRASRPHVSRDGAAVWANPLTDWTDEQMRAYRREHDLPVSDVAALMHQSGECGCGAFAAPGEREMRCSLFPEWGRWLEDLESRAEAAGVPHCRWGERPGVATPGGPACSSCQLALDLREGGPA